ncbi:MAG: four helix bundle protein [Acidobacteriota bacterium]
MKSYRDLIAWQKAMTLAELVYDITSSFPGDERFGMVSQLRRCAVSIASNLAEGQGRLTTRDWQHFLAQARGPTYELQTQLELALRLRITDKEKIEAGVNVADEVGRIINALLSSTRQNPVRKRIGNPT